MENLTTIQVLSLFDTNKEGRLQFAQNVMREIEQGRVSALDIFLYFKNIEEIIKTITDTSSKNKNSEIAKKFRNELLGQAEHFGKTFTFRNAEITTKEAGAKWHYENCNDPELVRLEANLLEAKKAVEERQKFLQSLPEQGLLTIDNETGEAITIYPPYKTSTTTLSVKLK